MRDITPLASMGNRLPEQGRIRIGVKTGNAMKAIDTFRFTSPDREALNEIAAIYGGTPRAWNEPRAGIRDQWEVITRSREIHIFLPPDALSIWYECWTAGGLVRQCDGETCYTPGPDGMVSGSCLCSEQQKLECKIQTRLVMILPNVKFGGSWRLDTKGWNAANELPAMQQMIDQIQANRGMQDAVLRLEQRQKVSGGKKKNFVVPVLGLMASPLQLLQGVSVSPVASLESRVESLALPPAEEDTTPIDVLERNAGEDDDETWEQVAELVRINPGFKLDNDQMLASIDKTAQEKGLTRAQLIAYLLGGQLQAITVNADGILRLRKGRG